MKLILDWIPVIFSIGNLLYAIANDCGSIYILTGIFIICSAYYTIFRLHILHPKGVFAVSAIIIDENNKMLLIKNNNGLHMQPGSYYRTNKPMLNMSLETPFKKMIETIRKETGLEDIDIELIDLSYSGNNREYLLKDLLKTDEEKKFFREYLNHNITPPPFFMIQEFGDNKTSKEKYHISMYYAFKLKNLQKNPKLIFKDIDEFENLSVYKDLKYVYNKLIMLYKKTNYPTSNIRLCRFNDKTKTVCWRMTHHCSTHCRHCFIDIEVDTNPININVDYDKIYNNISKYQVEKMVLSGGEPFLISNLFDIVEKINESPVMKFSICTNGIYYHNQIALIDKINQFSKFDKFVVSLEGYKNDNYCKTKHIEKNNNAFDKVVEFLSKCQSLNIRFNINVIGDSYFLSNTKKFIDFWRDKKFEDITISYPIRTRNNSKTDLLKTYQKIINGDFGDVSFIKNIELIIPICEDTICPSRQNIFSIDSSGDFHKNCIDFNDKNSTSLLINREDYKHLVEVHVAGLCIKQENEIISILIARRSPDRDLFPDKYEGCGGQLRPGELFNDGVKRHFKIEMGLDVEVINKIHRFYYISPNKQSPIQGVFFLCMYKSGEPKSINHTEVKWVTLDELKSMSESVFIKDVKNEMIALVNQYVQSTKK